MHRRAHTRPASWWQFIFYGVLVGGGVGSLAEVWGDLQRAAGASERLMELLHEKPAIAAPAQPETLPAQPQRRGQVSTMSPSAIPPGPISRR